MRVLIACEYSGRVRTAFERRGHTAISIDLLPSEDNSPNHIQDDVLTYLRSHAHTFDLMIGHPPCTYLTNSGVCWLYKDPDTLVNGVQMNMDRWQKMQDGADFFAALFNQPTPKIALENPIMHCHARHAIAARLANGLPPASYIQPWWFGEQAFKATGFTRKGLPPLPKPADALVPPKSGTPEHKAWSHLHYLPPSPDRWKIRSRTFPKVAEAMARYWG